MTEAVLERGQLKKELYTFLIITFAATYILQLGIYTIAGPLSYTSLIHLHCGVWHFQLPCSCQL